MLITRDHRQIFKQNLADYPLLAGKHGVLAVAVGAGDTRRGALGRSLASLGQRRVTPLALPLDGGGRAGGVIAMARRAVRPFLFGAGENESAMLALLVLVGLGGMTSAAGVWLFRGTGDFFRRDGAGGFGMFFAGTVAGVAAYVLGEMLVFLEFRGLACVAGCAELNGFLAAERNGKEQEQ